MRRFKLYILAILTIAIFAITSCEDNSYFADDSQLSFSLDTLKFDTIFTTIGSTTQSFRVINPNNKPLQISSIKLAGGDESSYRLNIDGELTNEMHDVEIPANDSIFIFVELTVDPNGYNQPMIVQDSVVFITNTILQDIDLLAWGQDFIPIHKEVLTTTTWTAEKPYLVYEYAYVDSGEVLTVEPGAKVYFHKNAGLYVRGAINATGNAINPIVFSGDRLEEMYQDIPDQWQGILLFPSDLASNFENVEIKNGNIGLQVGTLEYDGAATVNLHNVKIEHMSFAGIFALKSNITATNTLVADCGYYCITLLIGGNYNFTHCTVGNYWGSYSHRESSSVVISNQLVIDSEDGKLLYTGDLEQANWRNSIIWGNLNSEVDFASNDDNAYNYKFENCLLKLADSIDTSNPDIYSNVIVNEDPLFVDHSKYDYQLDTLSPAHNKGSIEIGEFVPMDLNAQSRLSDSAPDIGAYERIEKEDEDDEK